MIEKNRLVAITDGIVAVAATVMVLQLRIPDRATWAAVRAQLPTLLAYIGSFLQIFLAWHEHHDVFAKVEKVNHRIFLINCLWLFFVTLLPFVTGMVGRSPDDRATVLVFLAILLLEELTIKLECDMVKKYGDEGILDANIIHTVRRISFAGNTLAVVCAFFFPIVSIILVVLCRLVEVVVICEFDKKVHG